jgi:ribosomal protein S30
MKETIFYKLKHIPTGMFYTPVKGYGNNLTKKGKVYNQKPPIPGSVRLRFFSVRKNETKQTKLLKEVFNIKSIPGEYINDYFHTNHSDWEIITYNSLEKKSSFSIEERNKEFENFGFKFIEEISHGYGVWNNDHSDYIFTKTMGSCDLILLVSTVDGFEEAKKINYADNSPLFKIDSIESLQTILKCLI